MTPELLAMIKDVKPASDGYIEGLRLGLVDNDVLSDNPAFAKVILSLIARIVEAETARPEQDIVERLLEQSKSVDMFRDKIRSLCSEAAATITALQAELDELVNAFDSHRLTGLRAIVARAEAAEAKLAEHDCCMCGSRMEDHDIGSGHSPVSMYDYHQDQLVKEVERLKAKLKEIAEICEPHTADSNIARLCYDEAMETE